MQSDEQKQEKLPDTQLLAHEFGTQLRILTRDFQKKGLSVQVIGLILESLGHRRQMEALSPADGE